MSILQEKLRDSLMVQWLKIHTSMTGSTGLQAAGVTKNQKKENQSTQRLSILTKVTQWQCQVLDAISS